MTTEAPTIDSIFELYRSAGRNAYRGEMVSQLEHALQAGFAAERAGAPIELIVAALLHDYGHYIYDMEAADILRGVHDRHDTIGAQALAVVLPAAVTEPIRLHIEAKRYLCAVDSSYLASLSRGSTFSLRVQGGPYSARQAAEFGALAHAQDAAQVRRWDDGAKVPGLRTPDLEHFRPYLAACWRG
jgi:[1-hydroxy-2-(trimethylamino)ethyl]phosphonate dioxygenase